MSAFDGISRAETLISRRDNSSRKHKNSEKSKGKKEHAPRNVVDNRKSLMPGPQRTGSVLTVKSLQEFDKSLQGTFMICILTVPHSSCDL